MTARRLLPALVGVQVLLLLAQARAIVRAMASNADYASPLVMGHDAALYPGSDLVAGNFAWFNGLWATQLLSELPAYSQTSNYLPLLLTLVAIGALAWAAFRRFGLQAALITAAVPLAAGAAAVQTYAAWSARAPSWWGMVAAAVVAVSLTRTWRPRPAAVAGLAVLALYAGVAAACDQLVWATTLAPLAAAALGFALARAWRPAAALAAVTVAAAALVPLVRALAQDAGYRFVPKQIKVVDVAALDDQVANAVIAAGRLFLPAGGGDLRLLLGYLGGAAVLAALVLGLRALPRVLRRDADLSRRVWTLYWCTAAAGALAAFLATDAAGPLGEPVDRYLYALPIAAGALLALARRLAPAVVVAAVAGTAASAGGYDEVANVNRASLPAITAAMDRHDLDLGYVSYWSAAPMRHATDYDRLFLPAGNCVPDQVCVPDLHYIADAYTPRPGTRSFLLVDTSEQARAGYAPSWVTRVPAGPEVERTIAITPTLQMVVYPFDLAERMLPPGPRTE